MTNVTANENAKQEYDIPVSWRVSDVVRVKAISLEEAFEYVKNNADSIQTSSDAEYVSDSYQVDADDVESLVPYQGYSSDDPIICIRYKCDDELSKYTDSMLFESGVEIASGTFSCNDTEITYKLRVAGDVHVNFKGETYRNTKDFPKDLRALIKANPNKWDYLEGHDDIYIGNRNWFEFINDASDDAIPFEGDLSKTTSQEIFNIMKYLAVQDFGSVGSDYEECDIFA